MTGSSCPGAAFQRGRSGIASPWTRKREIRISAGEVIQYRPHMSCLRGASARRGRRRRDARPGVGLAARPRHRPILPSDAGAAGRDRLHGAPRPPREGGDPEEGPARDPFRRAFRPAADPERRGPATPRGDQAGEASRILFRREPLPRPSPDDRRPPEVEGARRAHPEEARPPRAGFRRRDGAPDRGEPEETRVASARGRRGRAHRARSRRSRAARCDARGLFRAPEEREPHVETRPDGSDALLRHRKRVLRRDPPRGEAFSGRSHVATLRRGGRPSPRRDEKDASRLDRAAAPGRRREVPREGDCLPAGDGRTWQAWQPMPRLRDARPAHRLCRQRDELLPGVPDARQAPGGPLSFAPPPRRLAEEPRGDGGAEEQSQDARSQAYGRTALQSYSRTTFARAAMNATTRSVPTPPATTATDAPSAADAKRLATNPASSSPSCGPPMKKIMFTPVIRPRSASGVTSCRTVWRTTVEIMSESPTRASAANVREKLRERPKTIVVAPYAATVHRKTRPCRRGTPCTELHTDPSSAPIPGAARNQPYPAGPALRIWSAKIGRSDIEPAKNVANKSSVIVQTTIGVVKTKCRPSLRDASGFSGAPSPRTTSPDVFSVTSVIRTARNDAALRK